MTLCFFASDLHGSVAKYERLVQSIIADRPAAVFLGGDLVGHRWLRTSRADFFADILAPLLRPARGAGTDVFLILGNDDPRLLETAVVDGEARGDWTYLHNRHVAWKAFDLFGYAYVPPTPFLLKDWERYDVSRQVDPGCLSPEEGRRTLAVEAREVCYGTIQGDLDALAAGRDLSRAIVLAHTPPYKTALDRAALDGRSVDHVPLDVHVGSIALRRFIESRQPLLTLHGHVHESTRITGAWHERLGRTVMINAAHDGPELALVRFDPDDPAAVTRELIPV